MTRKPNRRQLVGPEDAELEHLRSGAQRLTCHHAAAIRNADDAGCSRLRNVVDAEQCGQLDLDIDLFAALTHRGGGGSIPLIGFTGDDMNVARRLVLTALAVVLMLSTAANWARRRSH